MMWLDKKWVAEAKAPAFSHAVNFGSGVFETLRAYDTPRGPAFFRLEDHLNRFFRALRFMGFKSYSKTIVRKALKQIIKKNHLREAYVRLNAFLHGEELHVYPRRKRASLAIMAMRLNYTGKSYEEGLSCFVSSWRKPSLDSMPSHVKCASNYFNAFLALREARAKGFDEAILLDDQGFVVEASAQNVFIVKNNVLFTPSSSSPLLPGITRLSVIELAKRMSVVFEEKQLALTDLFSADEVFLTGTATEIMPVVKVNQKRFPLGCVTHKIRNEFDHVIAGKHSFSKKWLTYL